MTVVLLISGSTRAASTNSAALRTVSAIAPDGVETRWYDGLAELPAFNPDDDGSTHSSVLALREQLSRADAVLWCTPEYAGTLPGSLKNLLDWTVGTGDLYRKPVSWITVAPAGRGDGATATLRSVLGFVGADVDPDGVGEFVAAPACGPDHSVANNSVNSTIVATFVQGPAGTAPT
uniref:NADPH-dependent FMN reductase n=1 Tax=Nocardia abscessus TaxID=120957 RepID=UPI002457456B